MVTEFTPLSGVIGGVLIGLGALLLWWLLGRVAGISGITAGFLFESGGRRWRAGFLLGLLTTPMLYLAWVHDALNVSWHAPEVSWWVALAGLLVGLGTRWGSGCTSGHGVCGMSRWSPRSILATVIFMLAGIVVASFFNGVQYA
ncbi:YeeE/YedE family protein [Idiomarina xiamenensis]|uniref:Uncharacterized protein n=1 Tax=Idiomarina xiamenensis 10-D-4 TaxID=740709 RepID=K2JLA6_9GAMM|nr:YeeE/YedE thiosulfate transporter family protein [Idiomarina xiamenensis]EKE84241.1 hypothetical protein A10D4_06096 [Idiomarina xiamenensis 10-D-4]